MTNVIVSKRNNINVTMIKTVSVKKKAERIETDVDIGDNSWKIIAVRRMSSKRDPVGVMMSQTSFSLYLHN